jgi:hypothetical protein
LEVFSLVFQVVLREEDVSGPDVTIDDLERTSLGSQDINSTWVKL